VRNDGPGGAEGLLVPPPGVDGAGEARAQGPIERLRAKVRALERIPVSLANPPAPGAVPSRPACSLSFAGAVRDQALARDPLVVLSRLGRGGLHELKPASYRDTPAAVEFALAIFAAEQAGLSSLPLLWCLTRKEAHEWGRPYGPGLLRLGHDPALFLIVEASNDLDVAWALEEGLKSASLRAVFGQVGLASPLTARRLSLAAQSAGTPCLLITNPKESGLPATLTRWRIAASASASTLSAAPSPLSLHLTLERCRGAVAERSWSVEWDRESHRFSLVAPLPHRTLGKGESADERGQPASLTG